jgi:hypothetical protein
MELDVELFRELFPAFSDEEKFPDTRILLFFERAQETLSLPKAKVWPCELLTAHLLHLWHLAAQGQGGGAFGTVTSVSQGSVSVSMTAPQAKTAWQAWLSGSPYGQELWAWLSIKASGGWSVGGLPERGGFRKVAGIFL